jgi:hypothetical protein
LQHAVGAASPHAKSAADMMSTTLYVIARFGEVLRLADLEDLGPTLWAGTLRCGAPVLHRDVLGVLDLALRLALDAISFFGWHVPVTSLTLCLHADIGAEPTVVPL